MRIEMENVLYICITGFHTYETEGMGLQKVGKLLLLFKRERANQVFGTSFTPTHSCVSTGLSRWSICLSTN